MSWKGVHELGLGDPRWSPTQPCPSTSLSAFIGLLCRVSFEQRVPHLIMLELCLIPELQDGETGPRDGCGFPW